MTGPTSLQAGSSNTKSRNNSRHSNKGENTKQPFQRASGGPPPKDTCHCFYFKGYCKNQFTSCEYNHICGHCKKSGHSLKKCRSNNKRADDPSKK